jgi:N-acetylmuramoyl-L-alanine amidase
LVAALTLAGVASARGESALPAASETAAVSAIAARVDQRGAQTRLLFELTAPVKVEAFAAAGSRIIVDLPEVAFRLDPTIGRDAAALPTTLGDAPPSADGALIRSFRFGLFATGRSRVVIDLVRPARIVRAESVERPEGARLEIDLVPEDQNAFDQAVAVHAGTTSQTAGAAPRAAAPAPSDAGQQALPLVVIDPGHGGVDIGASGRHGELEKNIVFEFAQALKASIEKSARARVLLTRDSDVFIPLDGRVRFAREHGASLFLSIHADTLGAGNVQGATVYTVAAKATDAESARIAAKENLADQAAGVESKAEAEEVGDILFDLARRETRALGREFSAVLLSKWRERASLNKNPSRAASFVVLKAHDVPSALLELGYLSSEKDLANLTSPEWRARAAEGVREAIEAYFVARDRPSRADSE